jgi:DNA-binding XRE family transcriptional regulator
LYRVELLQRARRQLANLRGSTDESVVVAVLDQLALNPRPRNYWHFEEDEDVKYIYAGEGSWLDDHVRNRRSRWCRICPLDRPEVISETRPAIRKGFMTQIDPRKDAQRLSFGKDVYVVVREPVYEELLNRLDGLYAALRIQKNRSEVSAGFVETLLSEKLAPEQVKKVLKAPTFGKRVALLREFRGLDQTDLARRAGISQSAVSKLENDETSRPSYKVVHRVFEALGIPDLASYPLFKKDLEHAQSAKVFEHA